MQTLKDAGVLILSFFALLFMLILSVWPDKKEQAHPVHG